MPAIKGSAQTVGELARYIRDLIAQGDLATATYYLERIKEENATHRFEFAIRAEGCLAVRR